MTGYRKVAALILAAAAAAAGVGVASGERGAADRKPFKLAVTPAVANDVVRESASRFSALRENTMPLGVPPEVGERARAMLPGEQFTIHPVAARPEFSYYILESSGQLCELYVTATGGGGGGCFFDPAALAAGDVGPGIAHVEGGFRITAFIPDRTSNPILQWADGRQTAVQISNNLLSTFVKELPTSISWDAPDGAQKSFPVASVMEVK